MQIYRRPEEKNALHGGIKVDWIVLTAAILGIAAAVMASITTGDGAQAISVIEDQNR